MTVSGVLHMDTDNRPQKQSYPSIDEHVGVTLRTLGDTAAPSHPKHRCHLPKLHPAHLTGSSTRVSSSTAAMTH